MSQKDVHLDALWSHCEKLEPDAVRVLSRIAERLVHGQRKYGPIRIAGDTRSWAEEGLQESLDLAAYVSIGLLKIADAEKAQEEKSCEQLKNHALLARNLSLWPEETLYATTTPRSATRTPFVTTSSANLKESTASV